MIVGFPSPDRVKFLLPGRYLLLLINKINYYASWILIRIYSLSIGCALSCDFIIWHQTFSQAFNVLENPSFRFGNLSHVHIRGRLWRWILNIHVVYGINWDLKFCWPKQNFLPTYTLVLGWSSQKLKCYNIFWSKNVIFLTFFQKTENRPLLAQRKGHNFWTAQPILIIFVPK
jgi:hypothetical protein